MKHTTSKNPPHLRTRRTRKHRPSSPTRIAPSPTWDTSGLAGRTLDENRQGWKVIEVHGEPYERGLAHGVLLHQELRTVLAKFPFIVNHEIEVTYKKYLRTCRRTISPLVRTHYPEFYQELTGISQGASTQGVTISVDTLIAWNALMSMYNYFHYDYTPEQLARRRHTSPTATTRCSAFIATGKATKNGKIVMGHTSHSDLVSGSLFNIIMYMTPEKGHPFCMQTAPGYIASGTDWFITKAGIIGCETTIGDINYQPDFHDGRTPYLCRIREAMQYGTSLDDYTRIMTHRNAGDYAGSWLLGNIHTNEIMLCEIGLHVQNIQRTQDGIFYGMNSAMSFELRAQETTDQDFFDMSTTSGARNYRLHELLHHTYYGKLTPQNAQTILSDHYDVMLHKDHHPSSRTVCVHTYQDPDIDYYPHGCQDGKVRTVQRFKHNQ